jgi:hypothetical protein
VWFGKKRRQRTKTGREQNKRKEGQVVAVAYLDRQGGVLTERLGSGQGKVERLAGGKAIVNHLTGVLLYHRRRNWSVVQHSMGGRARIS